eukprot:6483601-Amphidinium_carterae.1
MGMESCSEAPTPMTEEARAETDEGLDPYLSAAEMARYRSATCILLYSCQDRQDVQYGVKELSRDLQRPRQSSEKRLKRVLRYLAGSRDVHNFFPAAGGCEAVGWSDSNWAGCKSSRKSTSGGLLVVGGCAMYSWSRTQSVIADSSGMAEWYALATTTAEALFLQGVLARCGLA